MIVMILFTNTLPKMPMIVMILLIVMTGADRFCVPQDTNDHDDFFTNTLPKIPMVTMILLLKSLLLLKT